MIRSVFKLLFIVTVCTFVGCAAKVRERKEWDVSRGETRGFVVPSTKSERKLRITATVTEGNVKLYVSEVSDDDSGKVLAEKKGETQAILDYTQPAGKEVQVNADADKKCKLTIEVISQ